jgi:phage/plasmid-associated DNA primase
MDVLGGFLTECCVFDRRAYVSAKDLYSAYCQWAERNGEKPLSQRWFGLRLSERGTCESFRTRTGKHWHGIGLLSDRAEGATDPEPEAVNHVNLVNLDSRKFPPCTREDDNKDGCTTEPYMENCRDIASQGAQGSPTGDRNAQAKEPADDGLDWSNGVAF